MNKLSILILISFFSLSVFSTSFYLNDRWLSLMFYEKNVFNQYTSLVDAKDFFLTPNGKYNPMAEYDAALKLAKAQNIQFKSKFPLRYKFLSKIHSIDYKPIIKVDSNITSITLAYPNQYMGNPASMFGHIFLIFKKDSGLLDSDLFHFIAEANHSSPFGYITGGLTGKFKGRFFKESFYKKIKEYTYEDDREVIYFDLKLSMDEIENLQLLSVDLQSAYFDYFFLNENCAFYIGKALNISLGQDIVSLDFYVTPSEVINRLVKSDRFLSKSTSKTLNSRFNASFNLLTNKEKEDLIQLITGSFSDVSLFSSNTLISFLYISEFVINNYSKVSDTVRRHRFLAYQQLLLTNNQNIRQPLIKSKVSKIKSNRLFLDIKGDGLIINYSPLYFLSPFNQLEHKMLDIYSFGAILFNSEPIQPFFSFINLKNFQAYTKYFGGSSWRTSSFFTFKNVFGFDASFDYGFSFYTHNKIYSTILAGVKVSNYDIFYYEFLDYFGVFPTFSVLNQFLIFPDLKFDANILYSYNRFFLINTLRKKYDQSTISLATISSFDHLPIIKFNYSYFY